MSTKSSFASRVRVTSGVLMGWLTMSLGMSTASADPQRTELARELFEQGVQKATRGKCDSFPVGDFEKCREAHELLTRAYSLDAESLSALRNLAQLEQSLGMLARAARHLRELARKAPLDPDTAHRAWAETAKTTLAGLQDRVPRITLIVTSPPPKTSLKLDDELIPESTWGVPIEVDPGRHTLHAQAPGRVAFEVGVEIGEGGNRTVRVELLARPEEIVPANPEPSTDSARSGQRSLPPPTEDAGRRTTWIPWIPVAAGGIALGIGAALGVAAINQRNAACPNGGNICHLSELNKGLVYADTSTALLIAGGAAVGGGLVWYFLEKSSQSDGPRHAASLQPIVGPTAIFLRGSFE